MKESIELPNNVDMEKELLAALLIRNGEIIPNVNAILCAEDFYRPEHRIIFRIILRLYEQGDPFNCLSIFEEIRKEGYGEKIPLRYVISIEATMFTNAYAITHAKTLKSKANLRRLILSADELKRDAELAVNSPTEIIARAQHSFDEIIRDVAPSNQTDFNDYLVDDFRSDVADMKVYADRSTGFANIDEFQFFTPGLYVIGATPAAGKTTFCQQLLHQLANKGETCIYCSYEMRRLELFSKSFARELFKRDRSTKLTAAQIRRGGTSAELERLIVDLAEKTIKFSVFELQDETIDDLLRLLRPLCSDKAKAPVVCLDYLQIVPTNRESTKLGIDDAVRKLKKFQRDTNTTFIVISSFNRMNYAQEVSFESFKESGNIEYTADVVWALQLDVMNRINGNKLVSGSRRKIDEAKKRQPRQIQLKCLKNRQGANYDCYFEYHSAHDYFEPCAPFDKIAPPSQTNEEKFDG